MLIPSRLSSLSFLSLLPFSLRYFSSFPSFLLLFYCSFYYFFLFFDSFFGICYAELFSSWLSSVFLLLENKNAFNYFCMIVLSSSCVVFFKILVENLSIGVFSLFLFASSTAGVKIHPLDSKMTIRIKCLSARLHGYSFKHFML